MRTTAGPSGLWLEEEGLEAVAASSSLRVGGPFSPWLMGWTWLVIVIVRLRRMSSVSTFN